jgi:hypothetical protein
MAMRKGGKPKWASALNSMVPLYALSPAEGHLPFYLAAWRGETGTTGQAKQALGK